MSQYPEKLVNTMKDGQTGALLGIPMPCIRPTSSYNKDLFDEAGLEVPAAEGQRQVHDARRLTGRLDLGHRSGDREAPVGRQERQGRDRGRLRRGQPDPVRLRVPVDRRPPPRLGVRSGSLVADGRQDRPVPRSVEGRLGVVLRRNSKDHFIADDTERNSDLLAKGNSLSSGHVAMGHMFQWYICCMSADATKPGAFKKWDIAVMPANSAGETTAPINIDTFTISKDSPVADRAFEAMTYLAGRLDLMALYGGTPAVGDQLKFFKDVVDPTFTAQFPGNVVNWQVALDMEGYAESPNHEAEMPNYIKTQNDYTTVFSTLATDEGLDLDKTISDLVQRCKPTSMRRRKVATQIADTPRAADDVPAARAIRCDSGADR